MKNYIPRVDVTKDFVEQPPTKEVTLFGKKMKVYDDTWRNHLHVVCTYACNASCSFCVERESKCKETSLITPLREVISEMNNAGILHTVSFTGGEPSLNSELAELLREVPKGVFTTINTNGTNLNYVATLGFDWLNISRHYIDERINRSVFCCDVPDFLTIKNTTRASNTKIRIQGVVNEETRLEDYLELIDNETCDDLSFRSIMLDGSKSAKYYHELYLKLIDSAFELGSKVIEQEIQDYYVYEVHDLGGRFITFSYSNMEYALNNDLNGTSDIVREFVLRPDGSLSSSWATGVGIIKPPE